MISRMDYYCLEEVCAFLQDLEKDGIDTFFISCNFSRDTFASPDFAAQVQKILEPYTFPRELLILEIMESAAVRDVAQLQQNIISLKEYGVRVALDDFGEGFTSFYDLQKYPIDGIKLDKGLVDQILTPCGSSILKAMIQVGHELDMTILAEGVETDEQVRELQRIHCDVIQGFRFSHPLPQWEARKQLKANFQQQAMEDCLSV
jgi:EAL domain-containing protein (putative c-di-GMP-specific phosphodiesterase class I)